MGLDINHDYMDEIVCPHCGHDNGSDHEGETSYEQDCAECGKEYRVEVEYSAHFSTAIFDREAEDAERKKRCEEHQVEHAKWMAECAKYPPGTRVRIKKDGRIHDGRVGAVANRELSTMVYVRLDPLEGEKPSPYAHSFHANEVEEE